MHFQFGLATSLQIQTARLQFPVSRLHENLADLRMPEWVARLVRHQILLRDISHIFRLGVLGEQVIEWLVTVRAHLFGDGVPPFLGVVEHRIDIEHDATKRIDAVLDHTADHVLRGFFLAQLGHLTPLTIQDSMPSGELNAPQVDLIGRMAQSGGMDRPVRT